MKTNYRLLIFACALLAIALIGISPLPQAGAQSVTAVHFELGGNQLTVESGGTIEAKSGSAHESDLLDVRQVV